MKKIAFINTIEAYPWTGADELWGRAAERMAKEGFLVGINVKDWKPAPPQLQKLQECNCVIERRRRYSNSLFWRLIHKIEGTNLFYRWLDKFAPDLVVICQGSNFENGGLWAKACLERKLRYAIVVSGAWDGWILTDNIFATALAAYKNARGCFFKSRRNLEVTEMQLGITLKNAKVIRSQCNVAYDAAPSWPREDGVLRLACVGLLDPWHKGQDILFKVLRSEKWKMRPIEVTLFGKGQSKDSLERLKDFWSLKNVKFGDFTDDIADIWSNHHALVLPSRIEGLPLSIIEAMLCGRLCIVTDVAGNTEVVEDNINGFVAKAPTVEFLDEAMERAWQRRDSWREIGQRAAVSIRKIIPRDPIGIFIDELKMLIG